MSDDGERCLFFFSEFEVDVLQLFRGEGRWFLYDM